MNDSVVLRSANLEDAVFLFELRSDWITRKASHDSGEILWDDHLSWLEKGLVDPNRKLYIAELDTVSVGTVRADYSDGVWKLSWTVSAKARGQGIAKQMVLLLAQQIHEPITAEIKINNRASARIAELAGMEIITEMDGVLFYRRDAYSEG